MTERRFDDAEVSAIFARAAESTSNDVGGRDVTAHQNGMTLAQLQEIGREVGIAPDAILHAVRTLGASEPVITKRTLGLPLTVTHTVPLGRQMSAEEWDRVVVMLRETFDARGRTASEGSLRQWTNGNLQVLLEPTAQGHRLRMRTTKGDARSMLFLGTWLTGSSLVAGAVALQSAVPNGLAATFGILAVAGFGMLVHRALQLPAWAKTRSAQMQAVADRVLRDG